MCAAGKICCDPKNPKELCPHGLACCACGADTCECPTPPPTPAPTPGPPLTPPPNPPPASCGDYWYEKTGHNKSAWRNVKDFGAKGDGMTDDTAAIQAALTSGREDIRSTRQPMVVYMPAGSYVISTTLQLYFYTHLVGNHLCPPKILMAPNTASETRVYAVAGPKSCEDCEHTNDFYYGIRNVVIDVSAGGNENAVGLHWDLSQGTFLRNVYINVGAADSGMFGESGSGGFMSDVTVDGGRVGFSFGNQQWTFRNVTAKNARAVGFQIIWNWLFSFIGLQVSNCPVGIQFSGNAGALIVADSKFTDVGTAVWTDWTYPNATRSLIFDHVSFENVANITGCYLTPNCNATADTITGGNRSLTYDLWYQGHLLISGQEQKALRGKLPPVRKNTPLAQRARPVFGEKGSVLNVMEAGAKGDGVTDDTAALQAAIDQSQEVFLPFGTYLLSSTLNLKKDTKLIGDGYSILMAKKGAPAFSDVSRPTPMLSTPDEASGTACLVDIIFMVQADSPGAVMVQWRVGAGSGIWDSHWRMMGGAYELMQVRGNGGGYFENVWGWVADHDMDTGKEVTVKNPRGFSAVGTSQAISLWAVAFEHSSMYQFLLSGVQNVRWAVTQTESPYWQSPPTASGMTIEHSSDVIGYGNGYYNWFLGVQSSIFNITNSSSVHLFAPNVNVPNAARPTMGVKDIVSGDHPVSAGAPYNQEGFCAHFAADINA